MKIERMDLTMDMIFGDEDIQDLIDRRMQVALEICIDIATHMVVGLDLPRKEKAADAFSLLSQSKVIDSELADKMIGEVGLRNILVHEYAQIDYHLAYHDLKEKLADLRSFAKEIGVYINSSTH